MLLLLPCSLGGSLPSALQEVGFICSCDAQLLCGVVCLDERGIVQGRKLKAAMESISNISVRRVLAGVGPGARVYNDQGTTQGVNVVRPVATVACCAQAACGWWEGAKSLRIGLPCGGACPMDCMKRTA